MQDILGDARWSQDKGIPRASAQSGRGFFFGTPLDPYDHAAALAAQGNFICTAANGHLLTVAATRAGKGVSLIIPNLLCYRGSAVVIDPKGELAWISSPRRRELGQAIKILDPWGEVNERYGSKVGIEEEVAHFNPLSILKPGSEDFIDNLAYLADSLIITQGSNEPYWDDTARELWAGLMAFVVENPAYSEDASLYLARLLLMKSTDELERTMRTAIGLGSQSVASRRLAQFEHLKDSTALMSVVSTARTQTTFLENQKLKDSMGQTDFSFDDLREGGRPTTVFLVLPPDKLSTYGRWLRLMVSIGIGAVQKGPLREKWEPELDTDRESRGKPPEPEPAAKKNPAMIGVPTTMEAWVADFGKYQKQHPEFSAGAPKLEPLKELPPSLRPPPPGPVEKFLHGINEGIKNRELKKREEMEHWIKSLPAPSVEEQLKQIIGVPQMTMSTSSSGAPGPLPVLFLLDEFGTIGKLAAVSKAYGLMAGLGMVMWAFVQDLNQLKYHYPDEWETFIANCNAMVCFGMMDQFTCEYVSKMLGMMTVRYSTGSEQTSTSTRIRQKTFDDAFAGIFGDEPTLEEAAGTSTSKSTTQHVVAQPLMSPDALRGVHPRMSFVIGHERPSTCYRLLYYEDKQLSAWARPDPKYAKR